MSFAFPVLALVFVFGVRWLVRRFMRGVARSLTGPRVQIAKLHMMDPQSQFETFHGQGGAETRTRAFEETFGSGDAVDPEESAKAEAAIARALAARQAPVAPARAEAPPRAFGRRSGR